MSRPVYLAGLADERAAEVAGLQRGLVSRRQLFSAGISDRMIHRRLRKGSLHRVHPGVYAVGHAAPTALGAETAAVLACGDHAVLSHCSAALIHKLIPHGDGTIHVTIGSRHGANPEGVTVHRTTRLTRGDVETLAGLPVTGPARTVLDVASTADMATTERAVEEAITQRLVSEAQLSALARRVSGRRGGARITAILDAAREPGITKSKAERRFRSLLRAAQLPEPRTNVRLHGFSVDCYWPDLGVVVEVQGYKFHSGRRAFERDTRKGAKLTAAGLIVAYVTWLQMEHEPLAVIARTAQTLARAA